MVTAARAGRERPSLLFLQLCFAPQPPAQFLYVSYCSFWNPAYELNSNVHELSFEQSHGNHIQIFEISQKKVIYGNMCEMCYNDFHILQTIHIAIFELLNGY
jgi:hypothetical protein